MCGIFGAMALGDGPLTARRIIEMSGSQIAHRGPDHHELLSSDRAVLGVERLRVIDLDHRADQPFQSDDVWLACNGEIYNYRELRAKRPDFAYRSASDVESILPLYLERGTAGVEELDGMFAIAIIDQRARRLVLARDRAGEKPLFYTRKNGDVYFASEIQPLLELPGVSRTIDGEALQDYLTYGYVLEPRTIFRDIRRVESGTVMTFEHERTEVNRYWDASASPIESIDADSAERELRRLLDRAVEKQLVADVPIGVFLSGGLDSAILLALASRQTNASVESFSVAFTAATYDETAAARRASSIFRSRHHIVMADEAALARAFDTATTQIAEPVSDPALLPTILLSRFARAYVTVVLSGEGADELFGGYPTYLGHHLAPMFNRLPRMLQRVSGGVIGALPSSSAKVPLEFLFKRFIAGAGADWRERHTKWFGTGLDVFLTRKRAPGDSRIFNAGTDVDAAMRLDYATYLRDNLLVKIDRATMLSSLESRAPFLDRDVTSFAFRLAARFKVHGLTTKWLLKRAARSWLPQDLVHQRKRGLSVPVAALINGALRDEVDGLVRASMLEDAGVVERGTWASLLRQHRHGSHSLSRALWPVIYLERWMRQWNVRL